MRLVSPARVFSTLWTAMLGVWGRCQARTGLLVSSSTGHWLPRGSMMSIGTVWRVKISVDLGNL